MGVVVAIIVVAFAIGVAAVWHLLVRGSRAATVSEADFGDAYDEVVADTEGDRDAVWRDFHTWELANEKERLSWEEPTDE
jgi:hypothetical protein